MTFPAITATATGFLSILLMALGLYTAFGRLKHRQSLGHGGSDELEMRMRRHGNLAEHAPIVLLTLALIEISGGDRRMVAALAVWLVAARLLHPIGLNTKGPTVPRFLGAASTFAIGAIAGLWLLAIAAGRLS